MVRKERLTTLREFNIRYPLSARARRGLDAGHGKGYRNILPSDSDVHYLSAKGIMIKQPLFSRTKMGHNPLELTLFVPSTKGRIRIPKEELNKRVSEAERKMSSLFGGYTRVNAYGGWISDGKLIEEPVGSVTSYTTVRDFSKNKNEFETYVEEIRRKYRQESVGIEFEGDMFFYEPKDTDKDNVPDYLDCRPNDPTRQDKKQKLKEFILVDEGKEVNRIKAKNKVEAENKFFDLFEHDFGGEAEDMMIGLEIKEADKEKSSSKIKKQT